MNLLLTTLTLLFSFAVTAASEHVRSKDLIRMENRQLSAQDLSCTNFEGWGDSPTNDGCGWYEHHDACEERFESEDGIRAVQACCYCGGGYQNSDVARIPPLLPGECRDLPNWIDMDNDGCEWYNNDETGCDDFGSVLPTNNGLTANVACCVCGGGIRAIDPALI